ncbi:tRNA (adenosine(37)-N6)-threonylcarbamoyltransferase complex ATPase subunit type 1 TsaE [Pseudoalteromonas sp. C2R02]|uniref:tRNA (adenosine(37)-N6)-threonylcarbamoyltransferase complex ATPase subunit type 1 TsaE n=1 Tax=Pseudoalteromonas sp. C2R02 TaxID=2841565 RepID=UPI001C097416|nr:tRNA (adenosine(37)-N6)-threonylcarbamoyltransferase complex ATPase subunit type 1 TsaE [Pseudoalteromonas sp. C2R02]MBU2971822.1 tRNA (adenosine(37)-N6)-threonylcarbamoyltransferase complex ATPase subunit type 1 TsaE [Pseudoalteromonas sp. C2R02]
MSKVFSCLLEDEQATVAMGGVLAQNITQGAIIYLHGDLGAGKTTFTRGVVQGFGHTGKVKSPTYTLVEPYELENQSIYHFDLYRLADPEELEFMGIRDYFNEKSICMIEWPEKGAEFLAAADLELTLEYVAQKRKVSIMAKTQKGEEIVDRLSNTNNA